MPIIHISYKLLTQSLIATTRRNVMEKVDRTPKDHHWNTFYKGNFAQKVLQTIKCPFDCHYVIIGDQVYWEAELCLEGEKVCKRWIRETIGYTARHLTGKHDRAEIQAFFPKRPYWLLFQYLKALFQKPSECHATT